MNRLVYVGMDVHKDTYSLCAFDAQNQCFLVEITVKSDLGHVLKYLKSIGNRFKDDDLDIVCGYEAGPTGFSLCRDLQKAHVSCVVMAPSSLRKSPDNKSRKTDKLDARDLARSSHDLKQGVRAI